MTPQNPRGQKMKRIATIMVCGLVLISFLTGCATFRKKFIRQKKKGQTAEEFIPVLDPVDYPPAHVSPEGRYRYHYSLWNVWDRELLEIIRDSGKQKKQAYLLSEMILQLQEMMKWVVTEKQGEIAVLIKDLQEIQREFDKPAVMLNRISIQGKLETNEKAVRNKLRPALMREYYLPQS